MKLLVACTTVITLCGIAPLSAQSVFTGLEPADNDWASALNWNPAEPGASDDVSISDGLTADITQAGEVANVIFVGDALNGAATSAAGTLNMNGGDLTALNIHIGSDSDGAGGLLDPSGTFNFVDGTINLVPVDQSLGNGIEIGSATVGTAGITNSTGVMTMGDGTTNPTLNYTEAHLEVGWGSGSTATFNFNSGTITGTETNPPDGFDPNVVIGQVIGSTGTATMTVGMVGGSTPATLTTDTFLNFNGGVGILTVDDNGSITTNRLAFCNDPAAGASSLLTINSGGTVTSTDRMVDREGVSKLVIDGGTLRLTGEATAAEFREVDNLVLGGSGAGSNLFLPVGSTPINILDGTASSVEATGTHTFDVPSVPSINAADSSTTWTAGTSAWMSPGDTANWSSGAPDGTMGVGDSFTLITSAATITGASAATWAVGGAEAAKFGAPTVAMTTVADDTIELPVAASFDIGSLRAVIDDAASVVSRTGDLRVARDESADAQQVDISDGSLTVSGDLIIGGVQDNDGAGFVGGVLNNGSNVLQTGGTVTVNNLRFFGNAALPAAPDVGMGGIYNLEGGTLVVTGDIIEGNGVAGSEAVDQARIDIDGGTLDFQGTNITVENFRVGNDDGMTGSFTLKAGQTLTNNGNNFRVSQGQGSVGTFIMEPGSTLNIPTTGGDDFHMAEQWQTPGTATFTATDATINTATGNVRVADGGTGTMTLTDTTWTCTGGEFHVGDGDNPDASNSYGGDGTLIMNGGTSITMDVGHFEMAELNPASRTVHRPVKGTLVMNDSSSITTVATDKDFWMGRFSNHEVVVTLNGGSINSGRHVQHNDGNATLNLVDGTIDMRLDFQCSNKLGGATTINISGGSVNVGRDFEFRSPGLDKLTLSGTGALTVGDGDTGDEMLLGESGTGGLNEVNLLGSGFQLDVVSGPLVSAQETQFTFQPDDAGISAITVGGLCTLANSAFVFDDSVADGGGPLTSATTLGNLLLIDNTVAMGPNDSFAGLAEGAIVKAYGDGTAYTITYQGGGDGFDVVLVAGAGVVDADMDGMPKDYEDANGLNDNDATDATSDLDGDGFDALFEYAMGTLAGGPNGKTSFPIWEINYVSDTQVELTYGPVKAGQTYTVKSAPDAQTFTDVDVNAAAADAPTVTVTDTTGAGPVELYQLNVTLP